MVDEKFNSVFNHLATASGLDLQDAKHINWINAAILYANIDEYILEPKSTEESIMNAIFSTKAVSYLKREIASFAHHGCEYVNSIRNWEHSRVLSYNKLLKLI